jgi:hypothetical protein
MLSYYQEIDANLINAFDPLGLTEMGDVQLMERTDMKFVLPFEILPTILEKLIGNYRILTIQQKKIFSYRTEYYDTPELAMFSDHHNGKLNRFKVRSRKYIESNLSFLEVKFKSNKGRVIKQRIEDKTTDQKLFIDFIAKHTPYNPNNLHRTIINHFNRLTLVDLQMHERVTVDFNLSFTDGIQNVTLNDLVIIEIKQNYIDKESLIFKLLKENSLRPSPVSKYCLGISLLSNKSKSNNFKQILMKINKISHVELTA